LPQEAFGGHPPPRGLHICILEGTSASGDVALAPAGRTEEGMGPLLCLGFNVHAPRADAAWVCPRERGREGERERESERESTGERESARETESEKERTERERGFTTTQGPSRVIPVD